MYACRMHAWMYVYRDKLEREREREGERELENGNKYCRKKNNIAFAYTDVIKSNLYIKCSYTCLIKTYLYCCI